MVAAQTERELKLLAEEKLALPDLGDLEPGISLGDAVQMELSAAYYDTADLALARAGATVRFREGEADAGLWTVKLPGSGRDSALARLEVPVRAPAKPIPAAVRDLVRARTRGRALVRIAQVDTSRRAVPLLDEQGEVVAELADDRVRASGPRVQVGSFREIELEIRGDRKRRRLLRAARSRLVGAGAEEADPLPKLVRALGAPALAPADLAVGDPGPKPRLAGALSAALTAAVERMIGNDPLVRLGDPEGVHQLRVGARTARSLLRAYAVGLDDDWAAGLRAELGWLGSAAGSVRDLDVLHARLRPLAAELGEADAEGAGMLLDRLERQRDRARRVLLADLRSTRYDALLAGLADAVGAPRLAEDAAGRRSARSIVRSAARGEIRHLDQAVAKTGPETTVGQWHRVRIRAKRARYCLEGGSGILGPAAAEHARALAALQDVLGDHHDTVVAEEWLRAAAEVRPRCGLAAGQLIAREQAERGRLLELVPQAWAAASDPALRDW